MQRYVLVCTPCRELPTLGIQRVTLETNASMVIQAVNSSEFDRCSASGLIWELKNFLVSNFTAYAVAHNLRSCNMVAHSLAAFWASLSQGTDPVLDSIPFCIRSLVAKDLALVYE